MPTDADALTPSLQEVISKLDAISTLEGIENLEKIFELFEEHKKSNELTNKQKNQMELLVFALFIAYRDGKNNNNNDNEYGWAPDELKATIYLGKIIKTASPENLADNTLFWFSWLTTIRLALLRLSREDQTWLYPDNNDYSIFGKDFSALQFSYLPELLVCVYKLFVHSFRPKNKQDSWCTNRFEKKRFSQVFWSRKFGGASSNALIWFLVNFFSVWIGAGWASCLINLAGFFFDIIHDGYIAYKDLKEYENLTELSQEYNLTQALEIKINKLKFNRNYAIFVAVGIFIGMAFFYAPILIPGLFHISCGYGAGAAMSLKCLQKLKWIGSSLFTLVAVGGNFLYGRLNQLFTWDFYTNVGNFLKNNKTQSIIPIFLVATAIFMSFTSSFAILQANVLTFGIPLAAYLAVKLVGFLCQKISKSCCSPSAETVELPDYLTSTDYSILQHLKKLEPRELSEIQGTLNLSLIESTKLKPLLFFKNLNLKNSKSKQLPMSSEEKSIMAGKGCQFLTPSSP